MPGIIGFQGEIAADAASRLMGAMVQALGVEPASQVDCFADVGLGLGRVHLGIVERAPQPLWNAEKTVALVMTGEIFSADGLQLDPRPNFHDPQFSSAHLLLAAYLAHGEGCAELLNGTFAAAIWDARDQSLLLLTDHVGSYPLYYAQIGRTLYFGSGARAVVQGPGLRRTVNLAAVAELLTFEHLFGDKTLFAGVQLLRPGTLLRWRDGQAVLRQYIDFQFPAEYEIHDEEYYIEEWIRLARTAVARQARGPAPLGVLLTGGLDSRTILGLLVGHGLDVRTVTFGIPGCDDEHSAQAQAHVLHLPHKFIPLNPHFLAEVGAKAVRLADGQKSLVHTHTFSAIEEAAHEAPILYKGFLGGTMHGDGVTPDRLLPARDEVWFEHVFQARNVVFPEHELPNLYTPEIGRQVQDAPRQALHDAYARSHSTFWVDKDSYVNLYDEDARFTALGVELARSRVQVRTPLADKDLLRLAYSVPPGLRVDKTYYRKAIARAIPKLAKVDYARTHRPVTDGCLRDVRKRTGELTRYWLRSHGMRWVPEDRAHPYADYANWLRHELRPWVEQTLLAPQALQRGYFQPAYVRNLVSEHMAGADHARRLGVLLTLELWHQQFID